MIPSIPMTIRNVLYMPPSAMRIRRPGSIKLTEDLSGVLKGARGKADIMVDGISIRGNTVSIKQPNKPQVTAVDLTAKSKSGTGTVRYYMSAPQQNLAKFALTTLINMYGGLVKDSKCIANPPTTDTIKTDVHTTTTVFRDVVATLKIDKGIKNECLVHGLQLENAYRLSFVGASSESLNQLESQYNQILESNNFYQGKSLRYVSDGVEFIPTPSTTFEDAILPVDTINEYQLNIVDFLTDPSMAEITKQRGIILHGAPGTGKTTSIKAMFNVLATKGVTCIYISDDSFSRHSVEEVFSFINTYLAPCLIVFEDIDLIATDRSRGCSHIIGPLLSAMNGIEDHQKPIVIVATTNRPEVLDAAVTRPCRFDRKIKVDFPSTEDLAKIFLRVAKFPLPPDLLPQASDEKHKITGAHVEEIYKTAALTAKKTGKTIEGCLKDAIQSVKKHFFLVNPKSFVGLAPSDDYDDDDDDDDDCAMDPSAPEGCGHDDECLFDNIGGLPDSPPSSP